jgi:hypothetical protein
MSIVQEALGQFVCAMRGNHVISDVDEDKLYKSENNEINTTCSRCGISINVKVEPRHPEVYTISRIR